MKDNKHYSYLVEVIALISDVALRGICATMLENEKFQKGAGAKTSTRKTTHHSFEGGLMEHTAETMKIALGMANQDAVAINKDVLIAATLWHDFGKAFDYMVDGKNVTTTEHYKMVGHLTRSYAEFFKAATIASINETAVNAISHAILAHHGRKEWGSPVEPNTKEAFVLHSADMLSSHQDSWE